MPSQPRTSGRNIVPGIFAAITQLCEQESWELTELEDGVCALIETGGDEDEKFTCFAYAREKQNQFIFHSVTVDNVEPEMRPVVAEFLTRLNYELSIGNFEMSFDDGDVRYKTSIDFDKRDANVDDIAVLAIANITIMSKFHDLLTDVMAGKIAPALAMEIVAAM
jgi:hypothetical protein